MNKLLLCGLLIAVVECRATTSFNFSLDPTPQMVSLGSPVTFTLDVAGFGNGTALGTYDLLVNYDPTVLDLDNATFGPDLDPDGFYGFLGTAGFQAVTPGPGSVELFEVSPDPDTDLLALQPDAFTIVTIVFGTVGLGVNSPLTLSENAIGDQDGNDISGESVLNNAAVTVTGASSSVPEPATYAMLGVGLLAMGGLRYRRRQESPGSGAVPDSRR